jgi:hypothetical protein
MLELGSDEEGIELDGILEGGIFKTSIWDIIWE